MLAHLYFRAGGHVFDERGETVATIFRGAPDSFSVMVKADPKEYATEWHWPYEHAATFGTMSEARGFILARHFGNG